MSLLPVPSCPHCADGGRVRCVQFVNHACAVFDPLPHGWDKETAEFHCECGWSMSAESWEESQRLTAAAADDR